MARIQRKGIKWNFFFVFRFRSDGLNDEENFFMQNRISDIQNRQSKEVSYFSIQYLVFRHSDPFKRSFLDDFPTIDNVCFSSYFFFLFF